MKKLIPKYQKGKKIQKEDPNTFIGGLVNSFGGDYETADKISAGLSIHPLLALILGALDTGYDLNGIVHGTKTMGDVTLDVMSMLPGVRYAREINLLKKSKNPMSYYYKELEKYLKRNSNSVNTIIGGGKTADLIEDSTHEK